MVLAIIVVSVIGVIAALMLAVASIVMAVPVDEHQEKIRECLPGANCGACGYSGCDGYAAAVAAGEAEPDKCAPGGSGTAYTALNIKSASDNGRIANTTGSLHVGSAG